MRFRDALHRPLVAGFAACALAYGAASAPAISATRSNIDYSALALQVALDRAGISPGLVDGRPGARTNEALAVFQRARGLPETDTLDPASREALRPDTHKATRPYTIAAEDVAGPLQKKIPDDLMSQGELETLAYTSIVELLAERFHTDERLLRLLNPKARFREGEAILVPDVEPMSVPAESKRRGVAGQSASRAVQETKDRATDNDLAELRRRSLLVPVRDVPRAQLMPSFTQTRDGHVHEALDIPAPRGTPVLAVEAGTIAKLFKSKPGGLTVYQFDPSRRYAYYYAHLDRYAPDLAEGKLVRRGDVLGYVGSTGNASPTQPHLHFAIFRLGPEQRWWQGVALDPYPVFVTPPSPS